MGEEAIEDLAKIIAFSVGPSGPNTEYLFRLADWHNENFPDVTDGHLTDLVTTTNKIIDTKL